mmetsp:Transcript_19679/g.29383  ORF Transcript_19679/g.29383 Transcript_19679/m.29383 type:complete len:128 (+) Transcript_19679:39-422(+)
MAALVFLAVLSLCSIIGNFNLIHSQVEMPGLNLRPSTLLDIPSMRQINEDELSEQYRQQWWEEYIVSFPEINLILQDLSTGDVLGYLLAKIERREESGTLSIEGEIISVAVDWRWQRRGLGTAMIQK